jgi:hypothetical protein
VQLSHVCALTVAIAKMRHNTILTLDILQYVVVVITIIEYTNEFAKGDDALRIELVEG